MLYQHAGLQEHQMANLCLHATNEITKLLAPGKKNQSIAFEFLAYSRDHLECTDWSRDIRHLKIPRFSRMGTANAILNSLNDDVIASFP